MRLIRLLLLAFILLPQALLAASTVQLEWLPPTEREDGTPITDDDIQKYRVYMFVNGALVDSADLSKTDSSAQQVITGTGEYCYSMSTVDTDGREGRESDVQCVTIRAGINPPNVLSIRLVMEEP